MMHLTLTLTLSLLLICSTIGASKKIVVDNMELQPIDLSARTAVRYDLNGKPCALVKVETFLTEVVFQGNVVGEVDYKIDSHWVYMTSGSQQLRISCAGFETAIVNFANYDIPKLNAGVTYKLKLSIIEPVASVRRLPIDEALYNYEAGNYNTALGLFLSEPDNPTAQQFIGSIYLNGLGVPKNEQTGMEWINKAIEKKNTYAMTDLALYFLFESKPTQELKAFDLFKEAGELGNSLGYEYIARMYKEGVGFSQDYAKAKYWFERAIEMGNCSAMNGLGSMYMDGTGVSQDYTKALILFEKAAEGGEENALCNLAQLYYWGNGVASDYQKAFDLFQQSANRGVPYAQYMLSSMYEEGKGTITDKGMAFQWLSRAAEHGWEEAIPHLAYFYYIGFGTEKNIQKAKELFESAANKGDEYSKEFLKKNPF